MLILLYVFLGYLLLLFFVPKGNNLQEILNIPIIVIPNFLVPKNNLNTQKVKFGNNLYQYFLFHRPKKNPVTKQNIVIFFHGGGWMFGNPEIISAQAQYLSTQGYISVYSNYRKAPFFSYQEMREDITLCLQKVVELQKEYKLEDKKIVIGGMSAGATLAALLAFQNEELEKINFDPKNISGLFLCGPPIDLSVMPWSIPIYLYAGNKGSEKFKKANPVNHFHNNIGFPILFLHGNKDGLVSYQNTLSFLKKNNLLKSQPKQLNKENILFHTIENGTHMDAAKWGHKDGEVREVITDWLKKLET